MVQVFNRDRTIDNKNKIIKNVPVYYTIKHTCRLSLTSCNKYIEY